MRLYSFRIRNFKSIIDTGECKLSEHDNIIVLVGQNEAGKSSVVDALDFFRNGPNKDFERLHRRKNEHPKVECTFMLDSTDIEDVVVKFGYGELAEKLSNMCITFYRTSEEDNNINEINVSDKSHDSINNAIDNTYIDIGELISEDEVKKDTSSSKEDIIQKPVKDPQISDIIIGGLLSNIRQFVFYDSFRDLLPGEIKVSEINSFPAVIDFQKVFRFDFSEIVKKDPRTIIREEGMLTRKVTDDLNIYWTQKLEEGGKYNFKIRIIAAEPPITEAKIQFMVDRDDDDPLYMEQKSKGFQWFSSFNMRLRALGIESSTIKNSVILIDEPGQGLHEKAQRDVKRVLQELAGYGAQIIYTTHCPNLIGITGNEFSRIRIVSNFKGTGTKVETVSEFAARPGVTSKDSLTPLITAMGIYSIGSLRDFNKLNIVVEGISDYYYFNAFTKLLNKSDQLYFLPACGVNNIPNLVSVLLGWGLNYKAVFDDDPKSGRTAYTLLKKEFYENNDELAHNHILKIKECEGIEDIFVPEDFYKYVLGQDYHQSATTNKNSKLAKDRKEILARSFLEKVNNNSISLNKKSIDKIDEVFKWLYDKFNIKS